MKWHIKDLEIKNQVVLAPMAGISNPAYMRIAEEMGASLCFTELLSAEAIIRDSKKTLEMLNGLDKITIPVGVQIFGSNAKTMALAAQILTTKFPIKLIDINMGCPVPKVAIKSKAGSALLKDPAKVYEIVSEVVKAVKVPVSVKIRSGWDENSINAVEIAKTIEKAGASLITVHARTRSQGYAGKANWDILKEVKKSVKIPVIGNGDVISFSSAKKMLDETLCDAVMLGRGALGNPWLIKKCVEYLETGKVIEETPIEEKIAIMKKHFNYLKEIKSEKTALLEMRTNILHYLKGMPNTKEIKLQIMKCTTSLELENMLDKYYLETKKNN